MFKNTHIKTSTTCEKELGITHAKYQALNLINAYRSATSGPDSDRTIEIRILLMPRNAHELYLYARLFEQRINFLRTIPRVDAQSWNSYRSADAKILAFRKYLSEAGLAWSNYKGMVFPETLKMASPKVLK